MSGKAIGIDLASSQSVVAIINEAGMPEVIENEEGRYITPSVISINGAERKIGTHAKNQAVMHPKNTVSLIKRFMGGQYDSPDIQRAIKYAGFDVINKNGKPYVKIDDKEYSPEELSSYLISYMKTQAENKYGCEVTSAVITCPAFYNDDQRKAVRTAGELAGLEVLRVINEPTAAILAAKELDLTKDKKILVVDLGGSTLDFSLCDVSKVEGQKIIEVLASHGDTYLGGADFDKEIVNYVCDEFAKDHNGYDLRKDQMAYARIVEAAEKAKCELSTVTTTDINLPYITVIDNVPQNLIMNLTRAKYDQLTSALIDKVINCGKECLKKAKFNKEDLDEILLVGSMTRSINVQTALANAFGCTLDKSVNPEQAVAEGAAIQAGVLTGNKVGGDILLLDVTPLTLGVETYGQQMTPMIEANTTIPTTKSEIYTTSVDNQPSVLVRVFQGERTRTADCKFLGQFELGGIMPAPRGVPQIEITFDVDASGILKVSAKDKTTGKANSVTITGSSDMDKEEIERIKAEAEKFKAEDERIRNEVNELNAAESYAYQVKAAMSDEDLKDKIAEDDRKEATEKAEALLEAIKTKELDKVKAAREELETCYRAISSKLYDHQNAQQTEQQAEQTATNENQTSDTATAAEAEDVEFEEVK